MLLRDFSNFDKMLLHLKLQTCFVLPGPIIMPAEYAPSFYILVKHHEISSALAVCHIVWDFELMPDNMMIGFFRLLTYSTEWFASDLS